MKMIQKIILCFALIFGTNLWSKSSDSTKSANQTDSQIKAFAMIPPLTVLLEILYPQGMIGLNYEPYPEDREFMPQNVAKLPVIGMQKGKEPIFEKIIALKPSVIFFNEGTDKKILESYAKFGIKTIEVSVFDEDKLNETIKELGVESRANTLIDLSILQMLKCKI